MYKAIAVWLVSLFMFAGGASAQHRKPCEHGPVVMVSESTCENCKIARENMLKNGIVFVEYFLDKVPKKDRAKRLRVFENVGFHTFPFFVVGKTTWNGWNTYRLIDTLCLV